MPTDTVQTTITYTLSETGQTDDVRTFTRTVEASELIGGMVVEVPSSGYTLDLAPYTLDSLFIRNRDAGNACAIGWELTGEVLTFNSPTNEIGFLTGPPEQVQIVTGAQTFSADYRIGEFVRIAGATQSSNNGDFVIEDVVSNTLLSLGASSGITADNPDTGSPTVTRVQKRRALINAGGWFTLRGSEITGNVTLAGDRAMSVVEIWAFGT